MIRVTRKRIAKTVIILVLIVGAGLGAKQLFFSSKSPTYSFDEVKKGTVTQLVTINGNVITPGANEIFSPTNGILDQLYVKNGDHVGQGDKLFTIRNTATAAEQAAADANYQAAASAVIAAKNNQQALEATTAAKEDVYVTAQNIKAYKDAHAINPVTDKAYTDLEKQAIDSAVLPAQKDFEAAKQAQNTAGVAIRSAQVGAKAALLAYEATQDTTVTAPVAGVVGNLASLSGQRVTAQSGGGAAASSSALASAANAANSPSPIMVVSTSNDYAVRASVNEVDINKIGLGQVATLRLSAVSGHDYTGAITQIDPLGSTSQNLTTYPALISIANPDQGIKPHMSATISLVTAEHTNVLTVANSAIVPHQNEKAVQILDAQGNVVFKPVKVGIKGLTRSEILSGIEDGARVILGDTSLANESGGASGVLGY
jgi:macrolide-specific efflux system membrane fusion protein